jgi:hypothetical protein
MPTVEIIEDDLKVVGTKKLRLPSPNYPEYISNLKPIDFSAKINQIVQTRRTRSVKKSDSLKFRKSIQSSRSFGMKSEQEISQTNLNEYIDEVDVKKYQSDNLLNLDLSLIKIVTPITTPPEELEVKKKYLRIKKR